VVILSEIKKISNKNFEKLSHELKNYIDGNKTGGILCLVYQKDKIMFCNKYGWKNIEKHEPLEFDSIFRIFSMTKPILCLTALMLYEEGKFELNDPISKFLPEFKSLKVLKSLNKETGEVILEETSTPITIKHLLTHTAGLSYGFFPSVPIDILYDNKFNFDDEHRIKAVIEKVPSIGTLKEFISKISDLPLAFHPGSYWHYGFNHDVLGYLIEKISGQKLDIFLKERIFDKIGMYDTDFYVPESKWKRLMQVYTQNAERKLVKLKSDINDGYKQKPNFLSGGAGLVSTLADYLKFTLMVLNEGEFAGQKIVKKSTIDLMTQNHLKDNNSWLEMNYLKPKDPKLVKVLEGYGFGLGVRIKTEKNNTKCEIGEHSWGGALNTIYWIDPVKEVIGILLTQYCPSDNYWIYAIDEDRIKNLVYEALEAH
jgi:CubicO group peptidase (beta-lactamase class C family)